MNAGAFQPPPWLRNPHVQSVLSSSPLRRLRLRRARIHTDAQPQLFDCGGGVRLQGFLTRQTARPEALGLVVVLHGWEGSVQSSYALHTGQRLLDAGFDVVRLNFRDHGDTHHLNPELFHSGRIDEVVGAVAAIQRTVPALPLGLTGFSLGGNFTLRVALRAPAAGIALRHAVAVCPVIDPAAGLSAIERAPWFYERYFVRKWAASLKRKQALFPTRFHFSPQDLRSGVRDITRLLVERHTPYGSLERYFESYSIAGERLAALQVPATILTADDDPIIPVADFHRLQLPPHVRLDVADWGGHCGFIEDWRLNGFAERYVRDTLLQALAAR